MNDLFDINGKCIVITGGAGVLCSYFAKSLAERGAKVCVTHHDIQRAKKVCDEIIQAGGVAVAAQCNVLNKESIQQALADAVSSLGRIDVLINGAGGNKKEATCSPATSFFDLPADALRMVLDLNCMGTMLPCQIFGQQIARQKEGVIINIASMNAFRPLTNIAAYSAAKAAITNFTQWLAVYMAMNHSPNIRVNAIAPGFFLTQQNRFLLTDEKTGELTPRGRTILGHTPMKRFGEPQELVGTLLWLISDASRFVTGTTIPVDGGFNAFSGV